MTRWGTFVLGLTVALAYWPGLLSAAFVPRWAAMAVLVPLVWRLDGAALSPAVKAGAAVFMGCCAFSLFLSPDPLGGGHDLMLIAILLMVFVGASGLERLDELFAGLGLGLSASSVAAVAQGSGWNGLPMIGATPAGLFLNSEILAEFAALLLLWGVLRRHWLVVCCAVLPVILCDSRVGWLSVLLGLGYAAWPQRRLYQVLVLAALLGVFAAALVLMGEYKFGTAGHRITLWIATIMSFDWLGNGLGWYQTAFPGPRFAHSDALQAVSEIGPGALLLFAVPILIYRGVRIHVAERAVFAAVCLQVAVSFPLHFPATGFVAAAVAGWLLGAGRLVRMGHVIGRSADVTHFQRAGNAGGGNAGAGRRGSLALPVRFLSPWHAGIRASQSGGHS